MGRKSGTTVGGYHPKIWAMHYSMAMRERLMEENQRAINKKKMRGQYWAQRLSNAMGLLRSYVANWDTWFDNDANIPNDANNQQMALLVEAKVKEVAGSIFFRTFTCRGIFIWQDGAGFYVYSKEAGKAALYVLAEFDNLDGAEAFVNGLPFENLGYGVVLDLLPAGVLAVVEK